jgi:hypothetical protein
MFESRMRNSVLTKLKGAHGLLFTLGFAGEKAKTI